MQGVRIYDDLLENGWGAGDMPVCAEAGQRRPIANLAWHGEQMGKKKKKDENQFIFTGSSQQLQNPNFKK